MTLEVVVDEVCSGLISFYTALANALFAKSDDESTEEDSEPEENKASTNTQPADDHPPDLGINVADDFFSRDDFGG